MPRRSVMTRRRTPLPSAITGIPGSGFPKRVRACASTIEVAPACSARGPTVSVPHARVAAAAFTAAFFASLGGSVMRTSAEAVLLR